MKEKHSPREHGCRALGVDLESRLRRVRVCPTYRASWLIVLLINFLLIVGCASRANDVVTVRETVIVERPVTVEVAWPTAFVTVEVTRIIEVPVTITSESLSEHSTSLTQTPTIEASATPYYFEPHPFGEFTGIQDVDDIARMVLTKNKVALRELLHFEPEPCIHPNDPYGPYCRDDEEIGTPVEAFLYGVCEGFWIRDEAIIGEVLDTLVSRTTGVYAVNGDISSETYGIVFTTVDNYGMQVTIEHGEISLILLGCWHSPDEALAFSIRQLGYDNIILEPVSAVTKP